MNKVEEMKELREKKKHLNARQKELKAELDDSIEERRKIARTKSDARKLTKMYKSNLKALIANIYTYYASGDVENMNDLANDIKEVSLELATQVEDFASACEEI